jgi:Concanavalin A-like lectin/glucanases superfamily
MRRKALLNLTMIMAVIVAVLFAPPNIAQAGGIGFKGEAEDHFWDVSFVKLCKDGFIVTASEQPHHEPPEFNPEGHVNGDDLPFSLHLGTSTIPVQGLTPTGKPLIAAGDQSINPALVSGTVNFFFTTLQPPTTPISVSIERWDHGLPSADEEDEPDSDESLSDDIMYLPGRDIGDPKYNNGFDPVPTVPLEDCTIDTIAPTTIISAFPAPNANGWNNTSVIVQLNASDNSGGAGLQQITYSATGAQPIASTTVNAPSTSINITAEGTTTISYYAIDRSGNIEAIHTKVINIDMTAPTTAVATSPPSSAGGWSNPPVTVQLAASDNLAGVKQITYSATGAQPIASTTVGGASATLNITAPGTTTISFYAIDNADNVEVVKTQVIQITTRVIEGMQALYPFDEGSGVVVHDRAGMGAALDLRIQNPSAVEWTSAGLVVSSTTVLSSTVPATRLTTAMSNTNELTIEAWITPANPDGKPIGRIVTLSGGASARDVTLAQGVLGKDRPSAYSVRLRTHHPHQPTPPQLASPEKTVVNALTHLVYTRDAAGLARLYIDGVLVAHTTQLGDFGNWDHSYPLALANEPSGDRPWLGAYHLVALYNRALSPAEVHQNFRAGQ